MAGFTRNFLKALGLTDDQVNAIVEEHTAVTDALKKQRDDAKAEADKFKADAEKLPDVQKELDTFKNGEDFKAKYDKEHQDFEDYKATIAANETLAKKKAAYRQLLMDENISEKRLDAVIRTTDFEKITLDKDGKLEKVADLKKAIDSEWGDFKVTVHERKPSIATPPSGGSGSSQPSRARELAQKFHAERYGAPQGAGKE